MKCLPRKLFAHVQARFLRAIFKATTISDASVLCEHALSKNRVLFKLARVDQTQVVSGYSQFCYEDIKAQAKASALEREMTVFLISPSLMVAWEVTHSQ